MSKSPFTIGVTWAYSCFCAYMVWMAPDGQLNAATQRMEPSFPEAFWFIQSIIGICVMIAIIIQHMLGSNDDEDT